jgi:hypothetical protein
LILLLAILAGILFGLIRAWLTGSSYQPLQLRYAWLVPFAVIPQYLVFDTLSRRLEVSDLLAAGVLVCTQGILLVFVFLNKNTNGFRILGFGLGMNFLVIVLNGGLMPISPETVSKLAVYLPAESVQSGIRYLGSKDVVLRPEETRLWLLSDIFLTPQSFPWKFAFSIGDVFIALGAFWSLWAQGGPSKCLVANAKGRGKFSSNQLADS